MFAACSGGTAADSGATSAGADTGSATATSTMGTSGDVPTGTSGSTGAGATSEGSTAASTAATSGEGTTGAEPVAWAPTLIGREFRCELIAREHLEDPAESHTQTRFNLTGTDLGAPVIADGTL